MPYADYQAFRVKLQHLISGEDSTDEFDVNTLDTIVEMAEARVHRDLRASSMISALSVLLASNAAAIPANLLELQQIYFSGKRPIEVVTLDKLRELSAGSQNTADAIFAAQLGDTLIFWPPATGTVLGSYYARPASLEASGLHATFLRYPEVYTYAALVEAPAFLGMEEREQVLERRYQVALANAQQDERIRVLGSGRLRVRAS